MGVQLAVTHKQSIGRHLARAVAEHSAQIVGYQQIGQQVGLVLWQPYRLPSLGDKGV
jgi:hypothetical protein